MPLSDTAVKCAKPKPTPYKLTDEKGLFLLVVPTGGKRWQMNYRYGGKQKTLSFGVYPDVSLKDARARRDAARKLLDNGDDPAADKKIQKARLQEANDNHFEAVAAEWFDVWSVGVVPQSAARTWSSLKKNVFPSLGKFPVSVITPKVVLDTLRSIEARGVGNTVIKVKTAISQIMRHAVQTGRAERDPVPDLRGALKKVTEKHFAAIIDPGEVGALLRAIDGYEGQPEVKIALKIAPLLFVRIGELRRMRWPEVDLEKGEWKYVVSKTKSDHLVPLARQTVLALRELMPLTGKREWVFAGLVRSRPISENTINGALRRMGYNTQTEMTGHGFRAMARTLLAEELHVQQEVIEHQLAHRVPDILGTAYNRTKFLKERKVMMQDWADYLDTLKARLA